MSFRFNEADFAEVAKWQLYDTLEISRWIQTPTQHEFFTEPVSITKGLEHTNMYLPSTLPMPNWFHIKYLYFILNPYANPDDVDTLLNSAYQLYIGNKIYSEGPLAMFPNMHLLHNLTDPKRAMEVKEYMHKIPVDMDILTGMYFKVRFFKRDSFTPNHLIRLTCVLEGELCRGVQ